MRGARGGGGDGMGAGYIKNLWWNEEGVYRLEVHPAVDPYDNQEMRKFIQSVRSISGRHFGHPDHLAAGEAALSAVFPAARDRLTFPELLTEGLYPHKVHEVLVTGDRNEANKWIDVSDTIEIAIEALKQHVSQIGENDVDTAMRTFRKEAGKAHGVSYAEGFKSFHLSR